MIDDAKIIVLDHGSGSVKVGFAGNNAPTSIFPSIVGRPQFVAAMVNDECKDSYIGDESIENSPFLLQKYPVEHGIVRNWDDVEKIWVYAFKNKLKVESSEHPVLQTEAPMNPKPTREKMIQLMFETFNIPSFYVGIQGILSLYASGQTTGLICEIGDGVTQVIPVFRSKCVTNAIFRDNFGGYDQTEWLQKILRERGYYLTTTEEFEIVRDIKEKLCYVAMDYDSELMRSRSTSECDVSYTLPDGNIMYLSDERFRCPELMFKPHMNGFELDDLIKRIFNSIMKCDIGMRKELYNNIIVSGGSTMYKNFPERVQKDVSDWAPPSMNIRVIAKPNRKDADWLGGSIIAQLPQFKNMVITQDEYNDAGPGIVHRKCFF